MNDEKLRSTDVFRLAASLVGAGLPVAVRSYRDGGPYNTSREQARRLRQMHRDAWPGPYVCPGCHAVGGERCAPGCVDDEMAREREDEALSAVRDDAEDE